MKHLLYILCLFVLSCDSGNNNQSTCENIVGVWQLVDIHRDFSQDGGCCDEDCQIAWLEENQIHIDEGETFSFNNNGGWINSGDDIETGDYTCDNSDLSICLSGDLDECGDLDFYIIDNNLVLSSFADYEQAQNPPGECFITTTNTYERIDNEGNPIIEGCTDEYACNYDETAIVDNDTCYYSEDDCTACVPYTGDCTDDWTPVCGCDGITYSNDCYASSHVIFATPGECVSVGNSSCEQIIGEWLPIDTQITIIGECDGYEDFFDNGYEDFDSEYDDYSGDDYFNQDIPDTVTKDPINLIITSEFICENNHLTHCLDESDLSEDLDVFDCYTCPFAIDGDTMTLTWENIMVLRMTVGTTTTECFGDVTKTYERVE